MKSIVKISVCIAFIAQLSNAQTCDYESFKDIWDSQPATCYENYNPWPITESVPGMCLSDVGLGTRSCIRQSAEICADVPTSCFEDCAFFHAKCCCSPLYPTIAPVAAPVVVSTPTSTTPTKAPVAASPTSSTPTKAPDSSSPTKSPLRPTRVPTDAPTIPLSSVPTIIPSVSILPSVVPSQIPSNKPSVIPTVIPSVNPSLSMMPSNSPTTSSPTLEPSSRCPWDSFTGFEPDCVNYDVAIGGDYCYFSAEHQRNWDNSGKFVGEKNPFRLCTLTAVMNCDLYDWYPFGAQCNSLCTNFHAVCCCHNDAA